MNSTSPEIRISLLLIVIVLLLAPLPVFARAAWVRALLDLAHVPMGALLTACIWCVLNGTIWRAVILVAVVTGAAELTQGLVANRTPNLLDFLWGLLGAISVVVCITAFPRFGHVARLAMRLATVALLLSGPILVAFPPIADAWHAYHAFPVICDFSSPHAASRWIVSGATIRRVSHGSRFEAIIDPHDESDKMDLVLFPVIGNWGNHQTFCCGFKLEAPASVLISIRDGRKVTPPLTRFDHRQSFAAGVHRICFDLSELQRGTRFAPLDVTRIQSLHIVIQPATRTSLRQLFLEREL